MGIGDKAAKAEHEEENTMHGCIMAQFNTALLIPECLPASTSVADFCKSAGIVLPAGFA